MLHQEKKHITTGRNSAPALSTITEIVTEKFKNTATNTIIFIGGPAGSGKSTFSSKLVERLNEKSSSTVISLDNYRCDRKDRENLDILGSNPEANKIDLIKNHLNLIKQGKEFSYPSYNTATGMADSFSLYTPQDVTIIEGELATFCELREFADFIIFIDSDWKTQLNTRISRDIEDLNFSKEKALKVFLESNLIDFQKFGADGKNCADIHIFCDENYHLSIAAVSSEIYDSFPNIFKNYQEVSLDGDVYVPAITIKEDGSADIPAFVDQLREFNAENIERIIVNECPLASFYLTKRERMELLTLTEEYFPGVIVYQLTNAPRESVMKEISALQNHSIDAFTLDLKFFEYHLGVTNLRKFICDLIENIDIPLFFFNEDFTDFNTYFVQTDKIKIAPISKRRKSNCR